jgi:hypothetical protein
MRMGIFLVFTEFGSPVMALKTKADTFPLIFPGAYFPTLQRDNLTSVLLYVV